MLFSVSNNVTFMQLDFNGQRQISLVPKDSAKPMQTVGFEEISWQEAKDQFVKGNAYLIVSPDTVVMVDEIAKH